MTKKKIGGGRRLYLCVKHVNKGDPVVEYKPGDLVELTDEQGAKLIELGFVEETDEIAVEESAAGAQES